MACCCVVQATQSFFIGIAAEVSDYSVNAGSIITCVMHCFYSCIHNIYILCVIVFNPLSAAMQLS